MSSGSVHLFLSFRSLWCESRTVSSGLVHFFLSFRLPWCGSRTMFLGSVQFFLSFGCEEKTMILGSVRFFLSLVRSGVKDKFVRPDVKEEQCLRDRSAFF